MMKRICFFGGTHGDWGGASRVLFHVIRNIDKTRYTPIVMLPQRGPACQDLEQLNIRYEIWPIHDYTKNSVGYLRAVLASMAFFRRNHVELIHLNYNCIGWRPAELLAARLLRIPVIEHVHIAPANPYPFLKHAKAIIAVSEFVARDTKGGSVPVEVIYNAVDVSRFCGNNIRGKLGIGDDRIVVSFHGQIRRIKGIEMFVEVARRIPDPRLQFLMTGPIRVDQEGAYSLEELQQLIRGDARISYLGYVDNINDVYATTDLVVMPSQWEETFGLVLIEAGANRKPVVATRVGGIPEVIVDGESGFLVEMSDIDGMVSRVELLINDASLRARMGQRARDIVEEKFTTRPISQIEAVYERLTR